MTVNHEGLHCSLWEWKKDVHGDGVLYAASPRSCSEASTQRKGAPETSINVGYRAESKGESIPLPKTVIRLTPKTSSFSSSSSSSSPSVSSSSSSSFSDTASVLIQGQRPPLDGVAVEKIDALDEDEDDDDDCPTPKALDEDEEEEDEHPRAASSSIADEKFQLVQNSSTKINSQTRENSFLRAMPQSSSDPRSMSTSSSTSSAISSFSSSSVVSQSSLPNASVGVSQDKAAVHFSLGYDDDDDVKEALEDDVQTSESNLYSVSTLIASSQSVMDQSHTNTTKNSLDEISRSRAVDPRINNDNYGNVNNNNNHNVNNNNNNNNYDLPGEVVKCSASKCVSATAYSVTSGAATSGSTTFSSTISSSSSSSSKMTSADPSFAITSLSGHVEAQKRATLVNQVSASVRASKDPNYIDARGENVSLSASSVSCSSNRKPSDMRAKGIHNNNSNNNNNLGMNALTFRCTTSHPYELCMNLC